MRSRWIFSQIFAHRRRPRRFLRNFGANGFGGVRVEFENHETWFKVVLSKVDGKKGAGEKTHKKLGEKLGENRRRIISMMIQNPSVTTFDLVAGIGISQTAIENNITWLRSHGYVRRVGPDKGGHWEVIKKMES